MSDATAAMNGATSGEPVRNQQQHPPQQRQRQRRNRRGLTSPRHPRPDGPAASREWNRLHQSNKKGKRAWPSLFLSPIKLRIVGDQNL